MQTVRCAACGKSYDYQKEGFCPRCGAYNRPPRREWVAADGSVHHGADRATARSGKVCYEKKVCYEEKQCFEEQTRRPRKKPAAQAVPKPAKPHRAKGKLRDNGTAAVVITLVLAILIALVADGGLLEKAPWNNDGWDPEPPKPDYNYDVGIDASCGDAFWVSGDLALQFMGYLTNEDGETYLFFLSNNYDMAMDLLTDSFVTIDDQNGSSYVAGNWGYSWICFDAVPAVGWQTLHIESELGEITVHDLAPAGDDSMMEWVWIVPSQDAIYAALEQSPT